MGSYLSLKRKGSTMDKPTVGSHGYEHRFVASLLRLEDQLPWTQRINMFDYFDVRCTSSMAFERLVGFNMEAFFLCMNNYGRFVW